MEAELEGEGWVVRRLDGSLERWEEICRCDKICLDIDEFDELRRGGVFRLVVWRFRYGIFLVLVLHSSGGSCKQTCLCQCGAFCGSFLQG